MNIQIPPRYINPEGKKESVNSYETFYTFYANAPKNLTARELAELSGFTEDTCSNWIARNKYHQRRQEIIQQQQQEEKQKKQSLIDVIGDTIEQQIKLNTLTDNGFMMKTKNTMQQYSEDKHLQLEHLDVTSETYERLQYAQNIDKRRPVKTIETVKEYYNLQNEILEQHEEQVVLEEAMELAENARFYNNLAAVETLQEDTQDEEY